MNLSDFSTRDLKNEKAKVSKTLLQIQSMTLLHTWANWQPIYDQLGQHLEGVRAELFQRHQIEQR